MERLGARLLQDIQSALPQILVKAGKFVLIVFFFWILYRVGKALIYKLTKPLETRIDALPGERIDTIRSMLNNILAIVLIFFAFLMLLDILGIKTTPILGAAGVVGIAVGLGAQTLVRDAFYGFLIVVEDQFRKGDFVTIGGISGTIEAIGFRTTRIRDEEGRLFILSNSSIVQVCNHSRGGLRLFTDINLPNEEDVARLEEALKEAEALLRADLGEFLLTPPTLEDVVAFDAVKTTYRISIFVHPSRRKEAGKLLKQSLREVLLRRGIKFV